MPGLDEAMESELKQKTSQVASQALNRYLYRARQNSRPAKEDLGIEEAVEEVEEEQAAIDPRLAADREALAKLSTMGEDFVIDGHLTPGGVPYITLAAKTAETAAMLSRELTQANLEHYSDLKYIDNIDLGRYPNVAAMEMNAEQFGNLGLNKFSMLYEVYLPVRFEADVEAMRKFKIVEGDHDQVIANLKGTEGLLDKLPHLNDKTREIISDFRIENTRATQAYADACKAAASKIAWSDYSSHSLEKLGEYGEELRKDALKNAPEFTVRFKTVEWDPKGTIFTDALKNAKVKFNYGLIDPASKGYKGLVEIKIKEQNLGHAKQIFDKMAESGKIRALDKSRIDNYAEFANAAENGINPRPVMNDKVFRSMPFPMETKHYVTYALQELQVEHSIEIDDENNTYTLTMKESEIRNKASRLERAGEVLNKVRPPELKDLAQEAYNKSDQVMQNTKLNRIKLNKTLQQLQQNLQGRLRRRRLTQDVKVARESAHAQQHTVNPPTISKNLGK